MKLKDAIIKFDKSTIKAGDGKEDGLYPLYTCSPVLNKFVDEYLFDDEAVILGTGGNPVINYYKGKFAVSTDCYTIKSNENFYTKYLYYFLNANIEKIATMFRGAGLKHLNKNELLELNINNIEKEKQESIIEQLDAINDIISLKKNQLSDLDNLIKSQFVEMFGDVIKNTNGFEFKEIGQIVDIITGTTPDTTNEDNWNGNIKWITPAEIDKDAFIVTDTERKISEKGQKSKSLTIMPVGTVLFTSRAPIGKTAIAGAEMCCNQGFKNCVCKEEINNIYLYSVLKLNADYFDSLGTGATFRELSKRVFEKIKISVPPIELQNQFADFVEHIDKLEFVKLMKRDSAIRLNPFLLNNVLNFLNCFNFLFR